MIVVDINDHVKLVNKTKKENKCIEFYHENWQIILCLISFISIVTIAIILSIRMNS